MIAQRFRSLGWVAGIATAATGLYLISLQVAAERGKLEAVEREIAAAQHDMRSLQTEFGTRASMRQLEKWNGDVLALSAPKADQFLAGGAQLASLNEGDLTEKPNTPPAVMQASLPEPSGPTAPRMQRATFEQPSAPPKLERVAMIEPAALTEIAAVAERERRTHP